MLREQRPVQGRGNVDALNAGATDGSIFGQGLPEVIAMEKSHEFTAFLFQTTNLSSQNLGELHVLQRLLASDSYYFKTSTFPVSPYTKAVWQLWIHYPVGYHGSSLKASSNGLC
jgi:hypothetical protein